MLTIIANLVLIAFLSLVFLAFLENERKRHAKRRAAKRSLLRYIQRLPALSLIEASGQRRAGR